MFLASLNGLVQFLEPSLIRFSRQPTLLTLKNQVIHDMATIWQRVKVFISTAYTNICAYIFTEKKVHHHPLQRIPSEIRTGPILKLLKLRDLAGMLTFMSVDEKAQLLSQRQPFVSKLLSSEKLNCNALSPSWKEALTLAAPSIEELRFSKETISPTQARLLTKFFPRVKKLSLKNCTLSDGALFYFKNLKLETLCLKECQGISELGLYYVSCIHTLKQLNLPTLQMSMTPELCVQSPYESTPSKVLKLYLYLSQYYFHFFFQNIKQEGSLTFQNFYEKTKIRRACIAIEALKKLKNLTHLVLPESEFAFTEAQISELSTLKKITHLDVECHCWQIGNALFQQLAQFKDLEKCVLSYKQIIGAEIQAFKGHTKLQNLTLKNSQITKAALLAIAKIQSLKTVNLEHSLFCETLTREEYQALGKMPNLESLSCPISDPALFATHTQRSFLTLKNLTIRPWTNIQDQDIEILCTIPQIEKLDIQNNCGLLTKRSLLKLENCRTLKEVHLHGAIFTEDVIKKFPKICLH